MENIAIIGQGAIGKSFTKHLAERYPLATIHVFSRALSVNENPHVVAHKLNYHDEAEIEYAAKSITQEKPLDLVIVATGILHDDDMKPEKALREISAQKMAEIFAINTIAPALLAKHFIPRLKKNSESIFAALSARVGSISDNVLGGWYAYRISKAALNMMIKNAAIEIGRFNKKALIVGLHPGTVDSPLSKPFQANVPEGQLFTPDYATEKMLEVLFALKPEQSGSLFAWDGEEIQP